MLEGGRLMGIEVKILCRNLTEKEKEGAAKTRLAKMQSMAT